ncbi:hypothetical protein RJ640_014192 [Escallonia rubra]|uniref:Uncharacterized protein n=1 Tax=Escallonia rubra TaxID=112253 RepID=A0AA88RCQ3_9ASTE|nr:hypothetical protein RJ640_014192 [Escallonia rubra]
MGICTSKPSSPESDCPDHDAIPTKDISNSVKDNVNPAKDNDKPTQVEVVGVYSTSLNLSNECTYTVWPVVVSGHGTPPLTTTIFMLEPGESASFLILPSWSGQLWARTLCSYGLTGRFNCLTGDCGTGSEECASAQTVPPVTEARARKFDKLDMWNAAAAICQYRLHERSGRKKVEFAMYLLHDILQGKLCTYSKNIAVRLEARQENKKHK